VRAQNPSKKIKGCGRVLEGCWRNLKKERTVKIQSSKKRGVKTSCRAAHGANAPNRSPDVNRNPPSFDERKRNQLLYEIGVAPTREGSADRNDFVGPVLKRRDCSSHVELGYLICGCPRRFRFAFGKLAVRGITNPFLGRGPSRKHVRVRD
jgi:hypothetical protein